VPCRQVKRHSPASPRRNGWQHLGDFSPSSAAWVSGFYFHACHAERKTQGAAGPHGNALLNARARRDRIDGSPPIFRLPASRFSARLAARVSNGEHPPVKTAASTPRFERACYLVAVAVTILWFCFYARYRKDDFATRWGTWASSTISPSTSPGCRKNMTTPPGYHFVVLTLSRGHPNETWARFTTLLFALLALGAFAGAWREFHRRPAGGPTLLFALLPIMQPFMGMAYSDVPGVAVLLWAWWAQLRERFFAAGVLFALSCLVRQTNLVWGAFFIAWEISRALATQPERNFSAIVRAAGRTAWQRGRWILLVIAAAAAVVLITGRLTPGTDNGNELRPQPRHPAFRRGAHRVSQSAHLDRTFRRGVARVFERLAHTAHPNAWRHARRDRTRGRARPDIHESTRLESRTLLGRRKIHPAT